LKILGDEKTRNSANFLKSSGQGCRNGCKNSKVVQKMLRECKNKTQKKTESKFKKAK
jgi:hypothetical protein